MHPKAEKERIPYSSHHPTQNDCNLQDFDLTKGKTALVFGTEVEGITDIALQEADEYLKIPHVWLYRKL